jgi:hypothetical protein
MSGTQRIFGGSISGVSELPSGIGAKRPRAAASKGICENRCVGEGVLSPNNRVPAAAGMQTRLARRIAERYRLP